MYSASSVLGETSDQEQDLTREVPSLLELMNHASSEVNSLESQLCHARERHSRFLVEWSRLHEDMLAQHGRSICRAKPYFDAAQVLHVAMQHVQDAVREFSASAARHTRSKRELQVVEEQLLHGNRGTMLNVASQEKLAHATLEVQRCQTEHDKCEQECARALHDCKKARDSLMAWRSRLGPLAIQRVQPCFQQLHQHQLRLATEQARISLFTERVRSAKAKYHGSLNELDRISTAVHAVRKPRASVALDARPAGASTQASRPEETPETVPEVKHEPRDQQEEEPKARELCLAADVFT